jgi:3',5'-cyclic AMP phosphodiesterase CpdA
MQGLIDAYLPTIYTDWAELRAICGKERGSLSVRHSGEPWLSLTAVSEDASRCYYRHRFTQLPTGSSQVAEATNGMEVVRLPFRTLTPPPGRRKVSFGVLTDLHIQRFDESRRLPLRTKRLYAVAEELAFRYLRRLQDQEVDLVIFPGDTIDPLDDYTLGVTRDLLRSVNIPCHLMIGNHETYGPYGERDFFRAFDLPPEGYQSLLFNDVAFILLSTPHQGSLSPSGHQFKWLAAELEEHADQRDTFVFAHFSLLLHPCVSGWKNDGMQQLYDYQSVLDLINRYPRVRAFIAGHKNVPSRLVHQGVLHLLCPQLIQAPCGYSVIEVHETGLIHNVFEIEEQQYAQISRDAYADDYPERYGEDEQRNYVYSFA